MMTIAETFKSIPTQFNPSAAVGLYKIIQVNLSGDEGGKWAIKIADERCELIPGGVDKPDLTLAMSDQNWLAIIERRLDPRVGFLTGKIKATGDLPLAMRIPNLFNWQ